jgi:hypothetical protein
MESITSEAGLLQVERCSSILRLAMLLDYVAEEAHGENLATEAERYIYKHLKATMACAAESLDVLLSGDRDAVEGHYKALKEITDSLLLQVLLDEGGSIDATSTSV